jgi:hypothetical protein
MFSGPFKVLNQSTPNAYQLIFNWTRDTVPVRSPTEAGVARDKKCGGYCRYCIMNSDRFLLLEQECEQCDTSHYQEHLELLPPPLSDTFQQWKQEL